METLYINNDTTPLKVNEIAGVHAHFKTQFPNLFPLVWTLSKIKKLALAG